MLTRVRALFTKKIASGSLSLPSDFGRQVEHAISIFANHDKLGDDRTVLQILAANGIATSEAKEIIVFLPIAFLRQWLPTLKWLDTYLEYFNDGKTIERKFSETKSFQVIWEVTTAYFKGEPRKETVLKIAGRSAAFRAINQLLLDNPNFKPEDVKMTQTIIMR